MKYSKIVFCWLFIITGLLFFQSTTVFAQRQDVVDNIRATMGEIMTKVGHITVTELFQKLENEEKINLIDVRTQAEFDAGHLHNAEWIPRGKLEFHAAGEEFPPLDEEIILYCRTHGRSLLAAGSLYELGYTKVKFLEGGFAAWAENGNDIFNQHGKLKVLDLEVEE